MKFSNIYSCVSNPDAQAGEILTTTWRKRKTEKKREREREKTCWWNTSEWRTKHKGKGDEESLQSANMPRELAERPCSVIHHLLSMPVPWQAPRAKPIHAFHSGDFTRTRHFSSHGVAASSFSDTKRTDLSRRPASPPATRPRKRSHSPPSMTITRSHTQCLISWAIYRDRDLHRRPINISSFVHNFIKYDKNMFDIIGSRNLLILNIIFVS